MDLFVKEIRSNEILKTSKLTGIDYSINPYIGCEHACPFCYSSSMKKISSGPWGSFVYVKTNAHLSLRTEIKAKSAGSIMVGSSTDPYMPIDSKYEITRKILNEFAKSEKGRKFKISIITRSNLVLRDIDLLKQLDCNVGISVNCKDEKFQKLFEPYASRFKQRINALKELKKNKIRTFVSLSPILPIITENDFENIFEEISKTSPEFIIVDKFKTNQTTWKAIENILKINYPEYLEQWKKIIFGRTGYWKDIKAELNSLSKKYNQKIIYWF